MLQHGDRKGQVSHFKHQQVDCSAFPCVTISAGATTQDVTPFTHFKIKLTQFFIFTCCFHCESCVLIG